MATLEERLMAVEVRALVLEDTMGETTRTLMAADADLKTMTAALDGRMERRFDAIDRRMMSLLAVQFTTLLTIIAAAVTIIAKLL